jgi:hypothetical protein
MDVVGMATGISPSGNSSPSPSPRGEKFSVPSPSTLAGAFSSRPRPRAGINPRGVPGPTNHAVDVISKAAQQHKRFLSYNVNF